MKGRLASRAHSFKENLLEALGHHGVGQSGTAHKTKPSRGSADNLLSVANAIESATTTTTTSTTTSSSSTSLLSSSSLMMSSKTEDATDSLLRDINLSLKSLENAVSKRTLSLVPGSVSILLERVLAIQVYVCRDPRHASAVDEKAVFKSKSVLNNLYVAVARLIKWTDHVTLYNSGTVTSTTGGDSTALSLSPDQSTSMASTRDGADLSSSEMAFDACIESIRGALSSLSKEIDQGHRRRRASSYSQALEAHHSGGNGAAFSSIDCDFVNRSRTLRANASTVTATSVMTTVASSTVTTRTSSTMTTRTSSSTTTSTSNSSPPPLPPKSLASKTRRVGEREHGARPRLDWFANPLFSSSSMEDNNSNCSHEQLNVDFDQASSTDTISKKLSSTLEAHLPYVDDVTDSSFEASNEPSIADFTDASLDSSFTSKLDKSFTSGSTPPSSSLPHSLSQTSASPSKRRSLQRRKIERLEGDIPSSSTANATRYHQANTSNVACMSSNNRQGGRLHSQQQMPLVVRSKPAVLVSSLSFDCTGISRPEPIDVARAHLRELDRSPRAVHESHALRSIRRLEHRFSEKDMSHPPPLPPKKRDIVCYMELLGNIKLPSREELLQSLPHTQVLLQNVWSENYHRGFGEFVPDNRDFHFPFAQDKFVANVDLSRMKINAPTACPTLEDEVEQRPPALPPKKNRRPLMESSFSPSSSKSTSSSSSNMIERFVPIVRVSDGKIVNEMDILAQPQNQVREVAITDRMRCSNEQEQEDIVVSVPGLNTDSNLTNPSTDNTQYSESICKNPDNISTPKSPVSSSSSESTTSTMTALTSIFVDEETGCDRFSSLVYANNNDGLTELRAGNVDELIILATESTTKNFVYQDAFLLTYRTFIPTLELLSKLEFRFRHFSNKEDPRHLRAARSSFSLLVRVVDSLLECDFSEPSVATNLSLFTVELVERGNLMLARALRTKFIQKYEELRTKQMPTELLLTTATGSQSASSILYFKSSELAEQITLLDAQLFWKLEPEELLLWVKEQNEEKSPNLAAFTKHFNAMSYWCRTQILQEKDHRERERLVCKFIKIMKLLRKHNNFNSFLSLLSALDSASIRRLERSKTNSETIKEFSALIDFSGSFKAYREALSRAKPPVIPYMGLVLQDLTFVHIGNNDNVKGRVNFAKRWQQYNILHNVRRFKSCGYEFVRNDEIIRTFDNFDDALSENELWILSETLKPRIKTDSTSRLSVENNNTMNASSEEKLT